MIDEALQFALNFCHEELSGDDIVLQGEAIMSVIHARLNEIGDKEGMTTFVLGGVLQKLKTGEVWKKYNDVQPWWTWGDFCKNMTGKSLGYCYAKIRIWEKSRKVGMAPQEIEKIGWSTADYILRESKSRNDVDRLIQLYRELGSREKFLQELQRQDEAKPREEQNGKRRYLKLNATEMQFYEESLEIAAMKAGKELYKNMNEEEALVFLIAQWRESLG